MYPLADRIALSLTSDGDDPTSHYPPLLLVLFGVMAVLVWLVRHDLAQDLAARRHVWPRNRRFLLWMITVGSAGTIITSVVMLAHELIRST
jgi:hypothetical protein